MTTDSRPIFALVDCNNFFASCERVFRPDLKDKPVAVLSNNDGVVVARSNEVKAMKIPMATPYFKVKNILQKNGTKLFSANFALYGDFSRRIVEILETEAPYVEVYSVDESFLEVSSLEIEDYEKWGRKLAARVEEWTGIPVSVGIGPTKTLAKATSEYVKKHSETKGAASSIGQKNRLKILKWLPVEDVWGVGRRLAPRLRDRGVRSAYDLTQVSEAWALDTMTIRGLKTIRELKGESSIPLEQNEVNARQKSISATRSFGRTVRAPYELESAVANFAARIAASLRRKNQVAGEVVIFLRSRANDTRQHNPSINVKLPFAASDTSILTAAVVKGLDQIIKEGHGYKRAGLVVHRLLPADAAQLPIIDTPSEKEINRSERLMAVMDEINKRWGKGSLATAREAVGRSSWQSKKENKSPAYSTSWSEIPKISF